MLTGSEYGSEMTDDEVSAAAAAGLVVVFGASDDLMEFRGAIDDEIGCYADDGVAVVVAPSGVVKRLDKASPAEQMVGSVIKAKWAAEPGYSWTYETEIEHATFEIVEDGEPYCRGIVFDLKSIGTTGPKQKRLALGDGEHWTILKYPDLFIAEAISLWMEEAQPGDEVTIKLVEMTDAEVDALPPDVRSANGSTRSRRRVRPPTFGSDGWP